MNMFKYCCMSPEERILEQILLIKYPNLHRSKSGERINNRNKQKQNNMIQPVNIFNSPTHTILKNHQTIIKNDLFEEPQEGFKKKFTKTIMNIFNDKNEEGDYMFQANSRNYPPEGQSYLNLTNPNFDKSKNRENQMTLNLSKPKYMHYLKLYLYKGNIANSINSFTITEYGLLDNVSQNGIVYIGAGEERPEESMKYSKSAIFYIKYDFSLNVFKIRDLENYSTAYLKLVNPYKLSALEEICFDGYLINIFITEDNQITLKVIKGNEANNTYSFDKNKQLITVGRSQFDADIKLSGEKVSRKQFTLEFNDDSWYILDGTNQNSSYNYTYIKPRNEIAIDESKYMEVIYGDYTLKGQVHHI